MPNLSRGFRHRQVFCATDPLRVVTMYDRKEIHGIRIESIYALWGFDAKLDV